VHRQVWDMWQGVMKMSEKVKLDHSILRKVLYRYLWTRQAPFNYETMQAGGWVYSMHPAMKAIYPDDEILKSKYRDYFRFYNCHPWMGNLILGACLAIESTKEEDATETAVELRTALMGPLAGLGDAIIWILPMTVLGAIAAYQALDGSIVGWVIAEAIQLVIWFTFNRLLYVAYDQGINFVTERSAQLKNLTEAASVLGLAVIGALCASTVSVHFGIQMNVGEVSQSLDDLLNMILPHFGNIIAVAAIYWGLSRKGMTSGKMVVILIVLSIILAALKILA